MDSKRQKGLKFIFLNFYYFVALTIVYIDLFPFCYNQFKLHYHNVIFSPACRAKVELREGCKWHVVRKQLADYFT